LLRLFLNLRLNISKITVYLAESAKFDEKGNKAAGTRARKALAEFTKAAKERRKEIQDAKTVE
jgi:hypothetical protein